MERTFQSQQPKENGISAKTWIPKDKLVHVSKDDSNKNLVKIMTTRSKEYQACKEWIVPQNLIKTQGYYEGQAQLWLPKALIQRQPSRKFSQEEEPQK